MGGGSKKKDEEDGQVPPSYEDAVRLQDRDKEGRGSSRHKGRKRERRTDGPSSSSASSASTSSSSSSDGSSSSSSEGDSRQAARGKAARPPPRQASYGTGNARQVRPAGGVAHSSSGGDCGRICCYCWATACCCCLVTGIIVGAIFLGLYQACRNNIQNKTFSRTLDNSTLLEAFEADLATGSLTIASSSDVDEITVTLDVVLFESSHVTMMEDIFLNLEVDATNTLVIEVPSAVRARNLFCWSEIQWTVLLPLNSSGDSYLKSIFVDAAFGTVDVEAFDGLTDLTISANNGDVSLRFISCSGPIDIKTGNGPVILEDVSSDSNIKVETANGDLDLENIVGDEVEIVSGNGDVDVSECACSRLVVESSNGDVGLDSITADTVEVETNNGGITMAAMLLGISSCTVTALSDNGDVELDLLAGFYDATPCTVSVETDNGDAELSLQGFSGSYSTETNNGEVTLIGTVGGGSIGDGSGGDVVSVRTANGDITIAGTY